MNHPTLPIVKKVCVAGCKHTTKDLILGLKRLGFEIDYCLTLSPDHAQKEKVSGYYDLSDFLETQNIPYYIVDTYTLKSLKDKAFISALNPDMLLVMGWQRLIPDWLLTQLSIGAFGMHGSSKPLPHGRGRSPLNWSLIQNKKTFYTHLFNYHPGVDDGPIVGVQQFDITPFDTALTLHFKNTLSMIKLCHTHLASLLEETAHFTPQPTQGASYYPKREAKDGLIYWEDTTLEIYNLIRAVTTPFPGAFTYLTVENRCYTISIWKAIPFDSTLTWENSKPGEILELFYNGMFVVKTKDSTVLVEEYEGITLNNSHIGVILHPNNTPRKVWENLPS